MPYIKLFERWIADRDVVKIYHGSESEAGALGILQNGWEESKRDAGFAEGSGMGAFLSPDSCFYGNFIVEFEIPKGEIRNSVVFDTEDNPIIKSLRNRGGNENLIIAKLEQWGEIPNQVIELAKEINGKIETVEEQILRINGNTNLTPSVDDWYDKDLGRIKGWITQWRFPKIPIIHLKDPSIAKPVNIFKK